MGRQPGSQRISTRHDVWSDVGRPEGSKAIIIARNLPPTTAFALARGLQAGGWRAAVVYAADPDDGRSPGLNRGVVFPLGAERLPGLGG